MAGYDVFISYRNTDDNDLPTRDAAMAESLYYALQNKGYNPFFSKYSVDKNGRSDYMTAINDALESVKVLVAVGTSRKNLLSRWVKREINIFSALMMRAEEGELTLLSYRSPDFPVDDLPASLVDLQSYADEKAVVRVVDACLSKASGFRNDGDCTHLLFEGDNETTILTSDAPCSFSPGLQIGSILDGKYRVVNLVGQGGMGCVYLAVNEWTNQKYAIKEIHKDATRDFPAVLQGIRAETDLMRSLRHPSIPQIFETIDLGSTFLIVMEYVEGEPLNKVLAQEGPKKEADVLRIARQLGQVLDYLHNQPNPIIHRDIKPANIMLQWDGKVKLLDFGTARRYRKTAREDTTCLGTIGYAAPEQFGGMGQTDARTDIYNLGATLYHLVTGKNPAMPPYEIQPIRQVDPDLSRGLEMIIQKCTQKDPGLRFQSARELLDALDNIQNLNNSPRFPTFINGVAIPASQEVNRRRPQPPVPIQPTPKYAAPVQAPSLPQPIAQPKPVSSGPSLHEIMQSIRRQEDAFYSAPTEPLEEAIQSQSKPVATVESPPAKQPAPSAKPKPKVRKVSARTKAPTGANPDVEDIITKLTALDPKSQQIVRDLIDRLS